MTRMGFPHSDISGSKHICCSPKLFAAYHVLHRLPMPRHSPYALLRLNYLYVQSSRINITVLSLSLELLCFILCSVGADFLSAPGKIVFFYPLSLTKKPDFVCSFHCCWFLVFSLYFVCHVCHTDSFQNQYVLYLIRFSMNFSLTFIKLYSIMKSFFITL